MSKDWRGVAVTILALGITISLIVMSISAMVHDEPAPQWIAYLVFTLFGAVIGVVASYVKNEEKHREHNGEHG